MPIYEYRCSGCKHQFETMQRFSDAPLTSCETCGGKLEKLISAPAFQFKGTGWYVTDYAKKGKKEDAAKESGAKEGKEGGDGKKDSGGKTEGGKTDDAKTKSETKAKSDSA